MTSFLSRGYKILLEKELHRSLRVGTNRYLRAEPKSCQLRNRKASAEVLPGGFDDPAGCFCDVETQNYPWSVFAELPNDESLHLRETWLRSEPSHSFARLSRVKNRGEARRLRRRRSPSSSSRRPRSPQFEGWQTGDSWKNGALKGLPGPEVYAHTGPRREISCSWSRKQEEAFKPPVLW